MAIQFRPAVREQTPLLIGLSGPSRSGKTYSALRIAKGLAQGGIIAMIDTESKRGLQYASRFTYLHGDLAAPFTNERYLEAITSAKAAGARVIIVDSMSHAHEGPGGMLEQHEAELDRIAGKDWAKRQKVTFSAWIKPKHSHNLFVNSILQMGADTHFIFCFRAKDKLVLIPGKDPVHAGWTPICSSRFEYEMSFLLVLPEGAQGKPDLAATASGLRDPFQDYIKPGIQLDEALGEKLAAWATGKGEPVRTATQGGGAAPTTQAGVDSGFVSKEQRQRIADLVKQHNRNVEAFLEWLQATYGAAGTKNIRQSQYAAICQRLADPLPLDVGPPTAPMECLCPPDPDGAHEPGCPHADQPRVSDAREE